MKASDKQPQPRTTSDFFSICLNDMAPEDKTISDAEQAGSSSHLYLTPESKNSSAAGSESEKDLGLPEWTSDCVKQLRYLVHYDLTKQALDTRLALFNPHQIVSKASALYASLDWTRGEIVALFGLIGANRPVEKTMFPFRSHADLSAKKAQCVGFLNRFKSKQWPAPELGVLFYQLDHDLTRSALEEELPDKDISDIKDFVLSNKLLPKGPTEKELFFIRQSIFQDLNAAYVSYELPLRDPDFITSLRASLNPDPAEKFVIDQDLVRWLVSVGCTRDTFRLELPGCPTREAQLVIKSKHLKYADAELDLIRKLHEEGKSVRFIASHLPMRDGASVHLRLKSLTDQNRRSKFKSPLDELVYYSKWYSSDSFSERGSRKRRREVKHEDDDELNVATERKKTTAATVEEFKKLERERQKHLEELEQKKQLRMERRRQQRLERLKNPKTALKRVKLNAESRLSLVKKLKEEADYFQSVTGDGKPVSHNSKRKRKQTTHFIPEFNNRKLLKRVQRLMIEKPSATKVTRGKGRRARVEQSADEEELAEEEEEEEEEVSPYDPYDITVDTDTPLNSRQLYVNEVYTPDHILPKLDFVEEDLDSDLMFEDTDKVLMVDTAAAKIVVDHHKNYNNMPSTFPPLMHTDANGDTKLHPANRVRLRTLLYPMHSELFLLAAPKNNELNPLFEIQKFFQIHFCLYFSHSEKIKEHIFEAYCTKLEEAVTNNDAGKFLFIIDKWNMLMLHLTPSTEDLGNEDINPELRKHVMAQRRFKRVKNPARVNICIPMFYSEICENTISVKDQLTPEKEDHISEKIQPMPENEQSGDVFENKENVPPQKDTTTPSRKQPHQIQEATPEPTDENLTSAEGSPGKVIGKYEKPPSYRNDFFRRLEQKTSISRFCVQQILIRIYSRVVSTRSRQLRSYKAFTAEVYGELLPSFTSEVLSKVGLLPSQRFYDLGSGVGNTSFQAALEFGVSFSGGCELMAHASKLTSIQQNVLNKHLKVFGLKPLNMRFALSQSFVNNEEVRQQVIKCDVLIVNNYLFDFGLNVEVGRLLYGLKPGTKIISLKNFITPRYKSNGDNTIFDYLQVEKHEMSDFLSVSWTANKVPYYISTVQDTICPQYL